MYSTVCTKSKSYSKEVINHPDYTKLTVTTAVADTWPDTNSFRDIPLSYSIHFESSS